MAAFVIVEVEVTDPVRYEEYKRLAAATVARHGGRYVVRGGKADTLEGDWQPQRIVVLEFPTVEAAKAWWGSEDYAPAKKLRHATARSRMIVIEGM
jgi:uncharacterized protein (DUF1330 family)